MIRKILLLSLFFVLSFSNLSFAVMANPKPLEIKQPDGTKITVKLKGDEFYSWFEDVDGYTIVKDSKSNFWSYAQKNSFGDLEPTQNIVGKVKASNLNIKKSLRDDNKVFEAKQARAKYNSELQKSLALFSKSVSSDSVKSSENAQFAPAIGTKTNFVLLIQFKDLKFRDNPPFKNSSDSEIVKAFDDMFNKTNYNKDGAVGSVKDYFKEISYGKMEYQSVISPIITLEFDEDKKNYYEYYAYSNGSTISVLRTMEMITYALKKLNEQGYDFKKLWPDSNIPEGFSVVHAGGGAEAGNRSFIWSHKSTLQTPVTLDGITFSNYHTEPAGRGYNGDEGLVRIGVVCHESLHFFGLPDLYDTTYMTGGLGGFCVMAGGEWNGEDGKRPSHPSVWCKYKLGLIDCQTAVEGVNSIGESAKDPDAFYIFKPSNFNVQEYFLMENRQSVGFDKGIPGSKKGILIYHVDERQNGNDLVYNDNYLVQLEEAGSGTSNWRYFPAMKNSAFNGSDSDYFRNSTISYFNDDCKSSPAAKSYGGVSSGIKISEISSSSSLMTFSCGKDIIIVDELAGVACYPNPARNGVINITNLPTNVQQDFSVEIFTLTSKLVRSYFADDTEYTADGHRKVKWDCKNDAGEDVAPGVYLVLVKNNSKKRVMKVAVIR